MTPLPADIRETVARALAEDIGSGDVTGRLIEPGKTAAARVTARSHAVLCGTAWFDEVFRQLDRGIEIHWRFDDGADLEPDDVVCALRGPAASLLSGERTALNFLQTLSGTATAAREFVAAVADTPARILDTRKTLPGLRLAQKYAVRCGGAVNHRIGLFDAVLIKENHIAAAGGLIPAVELAKARAGGLPIEVEVETLEQVEKALASGAGRLLLDNFSLPMMREAVSMRDAAAPDVELEASGNVDLETVRATAQTGVDFVSVGSMTKHLSAADFSMRFEQPVPE